LTETAHRRLVEKQLVMLGCRSDRGQWPSIRAMAEMLKREGVVMSKNLVHRIYVELSTVPEFVLSTSVTPYTSAANFGQQKKLIETAKVQSFLSQSRFA
jgi:hypothetical protein